jgi:hypothetical protein
MRNYPMELYITNTNSSHSDIAFIYNEPFLKCYCIYWCVTSSVPVHRHYTVLPKPGKLFQNTYRSSDLKTDLNLTVINDPVHTAQPTLI